MPFLVRFSLGFLLVLMALFMIALVLIQRGRGGGLAGAFGGAGGQSAFGTKAGDLFTRITVVAAAIWILLCILATNVLGTRTSRLSPALGGAAARPDAATDIDMEPAEPETKPAAGGDTTAPADAAAPAATQTGGATESTPAEEAANADEPASPTDAPAASSTIPPAEPAAAASPPEPAAE